MFIAIVLGFVVSGLSIFMPLFINLLIFKELKGNKFYLGSMVSASVLYGIILSVIYWKISVFVYWPLPASIIMGVIVGYVVCHAIIMFSSDDSELVHYLAPGLTLVAFIVVGLLSPIIGGSDVFQSGKKADLIGEMKITDSVDTLIIPTDNDHICLVSKDIAIISAQGALSSIILSDGAVAGSRYSIGEPVKQLVDGEFWWIFPLEFSDYFKWNQDGQVPGYIKVSAEDPYQAPQAVQVDSNKNEIHIKYLNSACFDNNARRYLLNNGYVFSFLSDWTFEVDDQWKPYYTISVSERKFGFGGDVVSGVALLDVQSGEINYYDIDDVPSWVDRVVPEDTIRYNAEKWGLYDLEGFVYTFFNKDKSQQPSTNWYLTYSGSDCQWFSGFTSFSSDNALTGVMTVDARTGDASFFKTNGVTEDVASQTATGLWSDFGYSSTELTIYNIYGRLTYVIPMSYNNQFVGLSMICLDNTNIKAKGKTLDEVLKNYKAAFSSSGVAVNSPTNVSNEISLTGVVERVGLINNSGLVYFKLNDIGRVFQVSTDISPEVSLIQVGDQISVTYSDTNENVVPISGFDITNIILDK